MDLARKLFDDFYDYSKKPLFYLTKNDPEKAHEMFIKLCRGLNYSHLDKFMLDNAANNRELDFEFSNAAGFNRNGKIPPKVLKYLGFNRVVVGTVTNKEWEGNPKPRCVRFPEKESMLNNVGWDSKGSEAVARNLRKYGDHGIPITINLGPTADSSLDFVGRLGDVKRTLLDLEDVQYVDRLEFNPTCPNICISRKENQRQLPYFLEIIFGNKREHQEVYLKASPDMKKEEVEKWVNLSENFPINGFVVSNTTTGHALGKGGGSGNIVYDKSLEVQKLFYEEILQQGKDLKIIAAGGINSVERLKERQFFGAKGIQIYTPIIFSGPRLLRDLRSFG